MLMRLMMKMMIVMLEATIHADFGVLREVSQMLPRPQNHNFAITFCICYVFGCLAAGSLLHRQLSQMHDWCAGSVTLPPRRLPTCSHARGMQILPGKWQQQDAEYVPIVIPGLCKLAPLTPKCEAGVLRTHMGWVPHTPLMSIRCVHACSARRSPNSYPCVVMD